MGVDEGPLNRCLVWTVPVDYLAKPVVDDQQSAAEFRFLAGLDRAASDVDQPVAAGLDQAPASAAEPGIDSQDANRLPAHGSVDSPLAGRSLGGIWPGGEIRPRSSSVSPRRTFRNWRRRSAPRRFRRAPLSA